MRLLPLLALLPSQRGAERRLRARGGAAPDAALDPAGLRDAAAALARQAGALLREGYGLAHRPERKGRIDLVTEYDRRSERLPLEARRILASNGPLHPEMMSILARAAARPV